MLLELQNGSDIRGIAIAHEEQVPTLTQKRMVKIASGIRNWLIQKYPKKQLTIAVGRDSRLSGEKLQSALMDQLVAEGIRVIDCGLATTPAMFMTTQFSDFDCDAGIMLTASHLPYYFNGVKIFSREGGAEKADIQFILTHTESYQSKKLGTIEKKDLLTPYAADLRYKILQGIDSQEEQPLKGLKIIVDAGNGAGGFFADQVLQPLGADTSGSQFLTPDGHFPNHIPNPDNKEAMASIRQAVLKNQADLGVIFDTDVDRSAVVTKTGEVLNRNNMIAVLSRIVLEEHPQTRIVTNSPTSAHLKRFIESLGGIQVRYISGYRNVINKAIDLNHQGLDTQLAIETSGHAAFKENYFLDDGAYVIAKILMLLPKLQQTNQTLGDVIAALQQPVETQEVRFHIATENYRDYGEKVIQELADIQLPGWSIDPENEEGIRFNLARPYGNGWFLLRLSLHEPLLVLQIENDQEDFMPKVLQEFHRFFNRFSAIDQEKLMALLP